MSFVDRIRHSEWMPYLVALTFFGIAFDYAPSYETFTAILCVAIAFQFIREGNRRHRTKDNNEE